MLVPSERAIHERIVIRHPRAALRGLHGQEAQRLIQRPEFYNCQHGEGLQASASECILDTVRVHYLTRQISQQAN